MLMKITVIFSDLRHDAQMWIEVDEYKFDQHFEEFVDYAWVGIVNIHPGLAEYISKNPFVKNCVDKIQSVTFQSFFGEKFEL